MNITVKESIWINASPELVWDYTQDWHRRTEWDDGILNAEVVGHDPRVVRIRGRGGLSGLIQYKLEDRPNRTSLALTRVTSPIISGGGGSWEYVSARGGTEFTQTNTLTIENQLVAKLLGAVVRWQLRRGTCRAMGAAKRIIESHGV